MTNGPSPKDAQASASATETAPTEGDVRPSSERFTREVGLAASVAAAIEPVIEHLGFRLVRVSLVQNDGPTLQIMAERPDGSMSADDCETISHEISPVIDVLDPLSDAYRLEISSPGIDRPLVRPSDFEDWAGYEAKIELREPLAGRKRFRGLLDGFEDGEVRIEVDVPGEDGKAVAQVIGIPITYVGEAKLMMTDDLIRESLRRAKALARAKGQPEAAIEGADVEDLPEDVEVLGMKQSNYKPHPKARGPKGPGSAATRRKKNAKGSKNGAGLSGRDPSRRGGQ